MALLGGRLIKDKEKRKRIVHIVSGVVILVHAYEKWDSGHHSYVYFLTAGLVFLAVALLHPIIERRVPWVDGVFFVIEGILSLIVAADFFHMGKKALPFCYLFVAVFQFLVAFVKSRKGIRHHHATTHAQDRERSLNP
ncbi:MAG: hypothetical protein INR73_00015 [Williamsia sp.]|nr:hypothetical protein [Williamsia sp.]